MRGKPVTSPAAWRPSEQRLRRDEWAKSLSPAEQAELTRAIEIAEASGKPIEAVTKAEFPLPTLGPVLEGVRRELTDGRGFQLVRGLPVEGYTQTQKVLAIWGIGLYLGTATSNNARGHLIGHIKDIGLDPSLPQTRIYATSAAQPYHVDEADAVGLLCLRPSLEGGEFSWLSSHSLYNAIVASRPDLLETLYADFPWDRKGEIPKGETDRYFLLPAFTIHRGRLAVAWASDYFAASQRLEEAPRLTPLQLEAIATIEDIIANHPDLVLTHQPQPGDFVILSNHTQLHARTAYTDGPEEWQQRHLLRLWISLPGDRELPDSYAPFLGGSVEVGKRGGIVVDGVVPRVTLDAE